MCFIHSLCSWVNVQLSLINFSIIRSFVSISIHGSHLLGYLWYLKRVNCCYNAQVPGIWMFSLSYLYRYFPRTFPLTIFNILYLMVCQVLVEKKGGDSSLIHTKEVSDTLQSEHPPCICERQEIRGLWRITVTVWWEVPRQYQGLGSWLSR